MEKRRNIQAGNFFLYNGEIVQVYDVFVGEILQDYKRKNKYCIVNKECEFLACHEEELKNIRLSEEMLEKFFIPIKHTNHECVTSFSSTEYMVTKTISRFQFHWNHICSCAEMISVCEDKRWWIGSIEYVHQLQNILNDLWDIERIYSQNENGEEIPFDINTKVKQFLWRENDDRK